MTRYSQLQDALLKSRRDNLDRFERCAALLADLGKRLRIVLSPERDEDIYFSPCSDEESSPHRERDALELDEHGYHVRLAININGPKGHLGARPVLDLRLMPGRRDEYTVTFLCRSTSYSTVVHPGDRDTYNEFADAVFQALMAWMEAGDSPRHATKPVGFVEA